MPCPLKVVLLCCIELGILEIPTYLAIFAAVQTDLQLPGKLPLQMEFFLPF